MFNHYIMSLFSPPTTKQLTYCPRHVSQATELRAQDNMLQLIVDINGKLTINEFDVQTHITK